MAQIPTRNGWGVIASLVNVQSGVGVNAVVPNSGVGAQVLASVCPIRLTSIGWRVDITPDVPAGTASGPTKYRLVVFASTKFPDDVTVWQNQAYPAGAHPEIPQVIGQAAASRIIFDRWLDFANGDPGLSQVASQAFSDGGPSVDKDDTLCAILVPIIDANIAPAPLGASNAVLYLEVFGCNIMPTQYGRTGSGGIGDLNASSMPRYDVEIPRN